MAMRFLKAGIGVAPVPMLMPLLLPVLALTGCSQPQADPAGAAASTQVIIPQELLEKYDFSAADTPNKRTALAYLYTAWNDNRLAEAREAYWLPGSFPPGGGAGPPVGPRYTIKRVIEESDQVVVLAFVEGVGIGDEITTIFGTPGGTKIGDGVVEVMRFDPTTGLIAQKVDIVEPVSEESYDFKY